jgi:hypothetical protein
MSIYLLSVIVSDGHSKGINIIDGKLRIKENEKMNDNFLVFKMKL